MLHCASIAESQMNFTIWFRPSALAGRSICSRVSPARVGISGVVKLTSSDDFINSHEYQFGLKGEQDIVKLLQENGAFIIPQYNYKEQDDFKGPRMHGLSEEYVLPDLDVSKKGVRVWVEVKTKSGRDLYRKTNTWVHGFNKRHYEHYRIVEEITSNEVWVVFIERTGEWAGNVSCVFLHNAAIHHTYEGNKMGRGGMVFFDVESLFPITTLIERLNRQDIIKSVKGQANLNIWIPEGVSA